MKKSRKKFLEGGKIHNYVEDPTKALYDNNLMIDKAIIQASQDTELMRTIGDSLIGLSSQVPGAIDGSKKTFGSGGKIYNEERVGRLKTKIGKSLRNAGWGPVIDMLKGSGGEFGGGNSGGAGAQIQFEPFKYFVNDTTFIKPYLAVEEDFNTAFGNAVKKGLKSFSFNGKTYSTEIGDNPNNNAAGAKRIQGAILTGDSTIVQDVKKRGSDIPIESKNRTLYMPGAPLFKKQRDYGTGGKVPVEIEGQEVVETPAGQLFQAQGPSHENGGIDLSLPEGTDIFSKRISIDGKSMADRKLARERTNKKLEKRSKYNPIEKNTFKRVKAKNDMEEMFDMSIMQAAFEAKNAGERQEAGTGIVGLGFKSGSTKPNLEELQGIKVPVPVEKEIVYNNSPESLLLANQITGNKFSKNTPGLTEEEAKKVDTYRENLNMVQGKSVNSAQFPFSTGDLLGMAGNLYQAYTNKKSAEAEIATDQPNINPYENFGNDALDANSQSMKFVTQMMDRALKNAGLEANSAQKRSREMSRSANTARAMDISIAGNKGVADSKIYDAFAQQMMQLMGQKAQLENQQDAYTMQGREKQDLNDRADKAARFATMRDADMNIGKAISGIGSNFNTAKSRTATEKLINSMSMFGKYNSITGEMTFDNGKADAMIADGTWKTWKHPKTGIVAKTPEEFKAMIKTI